MRQIAENLLQVQHRIRAACSSAGRNPEEITLVAVSKGQPVEVIREAYAAGQRAFGENYAQELAAKAAALADLPLEWHFTGHLQRNKAKAVAPLVQCVETIDAIETAKQLAQKRTAPLDILIQVKIANEATKSGVSPAELPALAEALRTLEGIQLRGLMCLPPYDPDPSRSRPAFHQLAELLKGLNSRLPPSQKLCDLSMGMSHDFEIAIDEGATIVRIGTALFGERA